MAVYIFKHLLQSSIQFGPCPSVTNCVVRIRAVVNRLHAVTGSVNNTRKWIECVCCC